MDREDTLIVPGRYDQVQTVCDFITVGGELAGYDEEALFHLQLATDEACTNIIEHAYGGEEAGELRVQWHINQQEFVVVIHDHGRPFDPDAVPNPAGPQKDSVDLKVGGLGLYFMRKLMDSVQFQFHGQAGNTLTMTKRLPGKEAA